VAARGPRPGVGAGLYSAAMRLLLVEDDVVIARELLLRWRARGWNADARTSLLSAEEALVGDAGHHRYDLVVLDLGLPDGDGVDWLARRRVSDRAIPVIMLTARDRIADRVRGLRSGADDYLVKPFDPDELDARIEAVQRRGQISRGERLQYGRLTWLGDQGCAFVDGRALDLMPREFEVLGLLLGRAPRLLPKRWLVDALAERNLNLADSAAEVYVSRLRRKLAGSGATIRTLRGFGYVLEVSVDKDG
jgi:DNA-binding response OmpR family regulator